MYRVSINSIRFRDQTNKRNAQRQPAEHTHWYFAHMNRNADNALPAIGSALIVGASGRMAAGMLSRMGVQCSVADLYGDSDTATICAGRVKRLGRIADLLQLESFVRQHDFVLFTGGFEGNFQVAQKLAQWSRSVFSSVAAARHLIAVETFNDALLKCCMERYPFIDADQISKWPAVAKDVMHSASCSRVDSMEQWQAQRSSNRILQEFIEGESVSQIYLAGGEAVECLGGTIQLTESLTWSGSISGVELSDRDRSAALKFATALVSGSQFTGVFGIDFIVNRNGIWPVDINPRIPASAEIVGQHVIRRHLSAFGIHCDQAAVPNHPHVIGKAVIFNRSGVPIRFSRKLLAAFPVRCESLPCETSIADIPGCGTVIETGKPVLTVFASGESQQEVRAKLSALQQKILRRLGQEKA